MGLENVQLRRLGGHLEILKWDNDNGAPWDSDTCANVALLGLIDIVKWAGDHGAP